MNWEPKRPVAEEEIAAYERDGVVLLSGILDLELVERLAAEIDAMNDNPVGQTIDFTGLGMAMAGIKKTGNWSSSDRNWSEVQELGDRVLLDSKVAVRGENRGHYMSATDTWKHNAFISELTLNSPVPKIAAALMRSSKIYIYGDQILVKPPFTMERTAWHQDLGYDHIQGRQVCGVRIPTTVETPEMGQVEYWRGSHASGKVYKVNYFISDSTDDDIGEPVPKILGHESDYEIIVYAPKPGDVIVHHLGTLHGAGGNASPTATRRAITIRYGGDDATYKFRRFAPPQDTVSPLLHDGDRLDGDPERFPRAEI